MLGKLGFFVAISLFALGVIGLIACTDSTPPASQSRIVVASATAEPTRATASPSPTRLTSATNSLTASAPAADAPAQLAQIFYHQYPRIIYAIAAHNTTFHEVITNTGNITLTGAYVQDDLVPDCNHTADVISPGAGVWWTCTALNVTKNFDNPSFARAYPPTGTYAADSDWTSFIVVNPVDHPAIIITQDPARTMVQYGADARFYMGLINPGTITLTNIIVTNTTVPACNYTYPQLAPYEIVYYFCIQPKPSASFVSTATVSADTVDGGPAVSNIAVSPIVMADYILLSGYHLISDTVPSGSNISFMEDVSNITTITGTDVLMTATIPGGAAFVAVQGGTYSPTLQGLAEPGIYWHGDLLGKTTHEMTLTVQVKQLEGTLYANGGVSTNGEVISNDKLSVNVIAPHATYVPTVSK